jgi:opacity protein-like surface antigen
MKLRIFFYVFIFVLAVPPSLLASSWSTKISEEQPKSTKAISRHPASTENMEPFSQESNNLALDVGQIFLMGDLGKYANNIGTQIHYTYGVSSLFGFDTSLGYSNHTSPSTVSLLSLLTGLRMNMSWYDHIIPSLIFGLGFYKPTYQDTTATNASSISAILFGLHLGTGIDLALTQNLFFGAGLTFHTMFEQTAKFANGTSINLGGVYTSLLLRLGTTF